MRSDITKSKTTEKTLQQEKERAQTYLDLAGVMFVAIDREGVVTLVNRKACEVLGYKEKEILGKNWFDNFVPERLREKVKGVSLALVAGEAVKAEFFENAVLTKKGDERIIAWHNAILKDEQGKITGAISSGEDVTEHKRVEKEMADLQEKFRQSQKMEAIARLAGGIAHDFNNLLTVIDGYTTLSLLDLKEGEHLWDNIKQVEKASRRAADLVRQLLAFSRRQILQMKVLDLNSLLRNLEKMLRRILGEDIDLLATLAEDLGKVRLDPGQMEQVIMNLAVNARDAMPAGGKLTIETSNVKLDEAYARSHISVIPGHYVELSVSDTGVGMSREVRERVFEPFFTTKEKGTGTGLGLSTVYGIIKQSGGNIWVYSELGQGTTFKIYLPRVEEELDLLQLREDSDSLPKGGETLLFVEDEASVRDLAVHFLRRQGYTAWVAADGAEALRIAQEHAEEKIHLLVTDIVMPRIGGKDLAERLRNLRPDLKVLFTSGYADDAVTRHGVLEPGIDFLEKPFSLARLSQKVRETLDK
jgi:PAS domain S-box-containing protein